MEKNPKLSSEEFEQIKSKFVLIVSGAFEDAAVSGLCMEGVLEVAIGALKAVRLEEVLDQSNN